MQLHACTHNTHAHTMCMHAHVHRQCRQMKIQLITIIFEMWTHANFNHETGHARFCCLCCV